MPQNMMKKSQQQTFKIVRTLARRILLPVSFAFTMTSVYAFEPFQANYNFNIAGLFNGTASRTLTVQDNLWSYSFKANIGSLATASELSHFLLKDSPKDNDSSPRIESLDHAYNFKILTNKKNNSFKVDWDNQVVHAINQNGENSYPAQVGMLDMLDLELQVREDIKHKKLQPSYLLADDKGITKISFVNEGEEKIVTDAGAFDTVRIRLIHENPKRRTYFWLAPKLDYLPVQVRQDDGNISYVLNLTSYKSNAK